jgi:hypothetical protein
VPVAERAVCCARKLILALGVRIGAPFCAALVKRFGVFCAARLFVDTAPNRFAQSNTLSPRSAPPILCGLCGPERFGVDAPDLAAHPANAVCPRLQLVISVLTGAHASVSSVDVQCRMLCHAPVP